MKTFRILALLPLALMSLMNVGYPFGTDPEPELALGIGVGLLGVAGFVAAYGLARDRRWSVPAALGVGAINVVGAVIGLVEDSEGAAIGLVVSLVALALAGAAGARRTVVA